MKKYTYTAILPKQSKQFTVFSFCAKAKDILEFAQIDRIGRDEDGQLKGFQRPQVASHINEIRSYLSKDEAVLPNSVVVAFTSGVTVKRNKSTGTAQVSISTKEEDQGFIVDGQQRLTALSGLPYKDFEVFVSCILCSNEEELRKQFILINNTRPLPKALIYELLPSVDGLPHRLSSRSSAAGLVERLNFDEESSLHGQINQHTNPSGILKDTVMQKIIMNSLNDGALRELSRSKNGDEKQFQLLSDFFKAVQETFPEAWVDKKPKTSRLVHSAGLISIGFVMEHIYSSSKNPSLKEFKQQLAILKEHCAWTEGYWEFGDDNRRPWNGLQFVPRDYLELTQYLIRLLKK
ncbi:DGQHR domain-containing protein DpdB [Pseudomonadales bacterium]|nr:DGQHR domain-containing protein DpdB [Pseudomonadales bacterium]